jgi:hypothetical protein
MNIWLKGSVRTNPYYRTAFRIAKVDREVVRHKTLVQLIGQTRRVIRTVHDYHRISGVAVTDAELNAAEKILLDPKQRLAEELLHHAAHPPMDRQLREMAEKVVAVLTKIAEQSPEPVDVSWLNELIAYYRERFVNEQRPIEQTTGLLELEIVPPLGPEE